MTGPRDGVIGNEKDKIISRFRTGVYEPAGVEKGRMQINAVLLELGNKNQLSEFISKISLKYKSYHII